MRLSKKNKSFVVYGLIGLAAVALATLWAGYHSYTSSAMNSGREAIVFHVRSGSTIKTVARELRDKGVIGSPLFFQLFARLSGKAGQIQSGVYGIKPGMTPAQFVEAMAKGDVISYAFTIIEGWNIKQVFSELAKLKEVKRGVSDPASLIRVLNIQQGHAEGLLMPDTYFYQPGASDVEFLRKANQAMNKYLAEKWAERDKSLPYTGPYQALIMASIVEKETGVADERPAIAGVFIRRLTKGMRLQTDPTVIYGLGDRYDGNLRREDLTHDTPYNTYTRAGLPPTPIAMPSRGAIDAALHPAPGSAIYFVATGKGDGRHVFSDTLAQHNAAVRQYLVERRKHLHDDKGT